MLPVTVPWCLVASIAEETFCSPVYRIQQAEVASGTRHPGEWGVLHDWSDLGLVKGHKVVRVKEVLHSAQQGHLLGGFMCLLLKVTTEVHQDSDSTLTMSALLCRLKMSLPMLSFACGCLKSSVECYITVA